jgi:hypothetical protein
MGKLAAVRAARASIMSTSPDLPFAPPPSQGSGTHESIPVAKALRAVPDHPTDPPPSDRAASDSPPSSAPRSLPPPLPQSARSVPHGERVAADAAFAERMLEYLASSDYVGALLAAEALLETHPGHQDLLDTAQIARSELRRIYAARLGSLEKTPRLAMGHEELLTAQALDFRAGLLLSRIDGRATIAEIVRESGIQQHEALRVLSELYLRRTIVLSDG